MTNGTKIDPGDIPVAEQKILLLQMLECFFCDPAVKLDDQRKSSIELSNIFFLMWVQEQNLTEIDSKVVTRYIREVQQTTSGQHALTTLLCLKIFYRYTAQNRFYENICEGVYLDCGDDEQFKKRASYEQEEE